MTFTGVRVLFMDGMWRKRCRCGMKNMSVLVDVGVGLDGYREVVGVAEDMKENAES